MLPHVTRRYHEQVIRRIRTPLICELADAMCSSDCDFRVMGSNIGGSPTRENDHGINDDTYGNGEIISMARVMMMAW